MRTVIIGTPNKQLMKKSSIKEVIQNLSDSAKENIDEVSANTESLIRIQESIEIVDVNNFNKKVYPLLNHQWCIEKSMPDLVNCQENIENKKIVNDKYSINLKKESIQTKKKIKTRT